MKRLPIPGFHGYFAQEDGTVWSELSGHTLKPHLHRGYLYVGPVTPDGKSGKRVHRLIAAAFLGPRPPGMHINHRDANKQNNRPENLEYVDAFANMAHAVRMGLAPTGARNARSKLTMEKAAEIRALYAAGHAKRALARRFGVAFGTVRNLLDGITWKGALPAPKENA